MISKINNGPTFKNRSFTKSEAHALLRGDCKRAFKVMERIHLGDISNTKKAGQALNNFTIDNMDKYTKKYGEKPNLKFGAEAFYTLSDLAKGKISFAPRANKGLEEAELAGFHRNSPETMFSTIGKIAHGIISPKAALEDIKKSEVQIGSNEATKGLREYLQAKLPAEHKHEGFLHAIARKMAEVVGA